MKGPKAAPVPPRIVHAAMHRSAERMARELTPKSRSTIAVGGASLPARTACQAPSKKRRNTSSGKLAPGAAVMLHLRSRYVSKAAILTVPVSPVPVENRSPA